MKQLRIALDLDDTIFDWRNAHEKRFNCDVSKLPTSVINSQVASIKYDSKFWSNLALLEKPDFTPCIYATKRMNSKKYTIKCLKKYSLPRVPIYQIEKQEDNKARIIKGRCDVLIDDSWFNVQQCLSRGVPALLITRPLNQNIDTPYRVNSLSYKEIEKKYYELFGSM